MGFAVENMNLWSDIKDLYSRLNTQRSKFSFSQLTIPENQNKKIQSLDIHDMSEYIKGMAGNKYISGIAKGCGDPAIEELITTSYTDILSTQITSMENTCAYDAYDGSKKSSGYNSGNRGGNNGSQKTSSYTCSVNCGSVCPGI